MDYISEAYFTKKVQDQISELKATQAVIESNSNTVVPAQVCALWCALATHNGHAWTEALIEVGQLHWITIADSVVHITPEVKTALCWGDLKSCLLGQNLAFPDGFSAIQMANWAYPLVELGRCRRSIIAPEPSDKPEVVWRHTTALGREMWEVLVNTDGYWVLIVTRMDDRGHHCGVEMIWDEFGKKRVLVSNDWSFDLEPPTEFIEDCKPLISMFKSWSNT